MADTTPSVIFDNDRLAVAKHAAVAAVQTLLIGGYGSEGHTLLAVAAVIIWSATGASDGRVSLEEAIESVSADARLLAKLNTAADLREFIRRS